MLDPALWLPVGPPASGKSTIVTRMMNAEILPRQALVSPDEMRLTLTGDMACQEENGMVFGICEKIAGVRLMRGLPVWFDATNLNGQTVDMLFSMATMYGLPTYSILMQTPHDTCRIWNATRENPVPDHVMDRMFERAQNPTLRGLVLRSDDILGGPGNLEEAILYAIRYAQDLEEAIDEATISEI